MYRVEDKYILSEIDYKILQSRLDPILKKDSDYNNTSVYKVSSVYFDDYYDTNYNDTVEGNPFRKKYRIRIYNDSLDTIKLEVKFKMYNRILKKSRIINKEQMLLYLNGNIVDNLIYDEDDPISQFNIAIKSSKLSPKIIVTYDRMAYVNDAGNVRITFDNHIRSSRQIMRLGSQNIVYESLFPDDYVLEVKYNEFLPDYIAQVLEINNMWQMSYSKYKVCRELYM